MKKYLMTGIAALTLAGIFTSCSHDMDNYTKGDTTETIKENYENAFIATFGQPAANQTWGFGTTTSTVTGTRGMTRAIQPSYNFPDDADASKFLADVPAGVEKLTQNIARANNWIDETWQGDINIWGGSTAEGNWQDRSGGTLYIKGNCDFSNRNFYFDGHSELYLLEGATLTLNSNSAGNLQTNTNIYIASGAKLVTSGELKLNNGLHIYNHGTIEANKLSTNSNSVLYNVGTVTVNGKISVENTESAIINDGIITAADLNTAGSGKFENNGDVTISGTTFVNSNDNTWVNNGQYHTGNFIYNAASDEVINNCRLTVDEDFNINLGDNPGNGNFKMDAGAGVVTKNFNGGGNWAKSYSTGWSSFNGGPFYIYMGENSVFKVTETATMNATKADYGIYGPEEGGYAVFEAKNIVAGAANQGYEVTYGNNLYVSAESHFENGLSGSYPYIDIKGNAKIYASGFKKGAPEVYIPATECNPGFGDEIQKIRVIAEDLNANESKTFEGGSDFDFNDVVFDVIWNKTQDTVSVRVLADGAEYTMYIGGKEGSVEGLMTVNEMFKAANGREFSKREYPNTAPGSHADHDNLAYTPYEFRLEKGTEWEGEDIGTIAHSIRVRVLKSGVLLTLDAPKAGAAAKVAVGTDYDWCDENQFIDAQDKYNGKFARYVKRELGDDWYKSYVK